MANTDVVVTFLSMEAEQPRVWCSQPELIETLDSCHEPTSKNGSRRFEKAQRLPATSQRQDMPSSSPAGGVGVCALRQSCLAVHTVSWAPSVLCVLGLQRQR